MVGGAVVVVELGGAVVGGPAAISPTGAPGPSIDSAGPRELTGDESAPTWARLTLDRPSYRGDATRTSRRFALASSRRRRRRRAGDAPAPRQAGPLCTRGSTGQVVAGSR